jgi:hydrogenase maturation protein HypF
MALGCIWRAYGDAAAEVIERFFARVDEKKRTLVGKMLRSRVNTPLTSSAGRLFDAVSSILGLKDVNGYEGEAAMALEYTAAAAAERIEPYPYALVAEHGITRIETGSVIKGVVAEMARGMDRSRISARFHQTVADIIVTVSSGLSERTGIKDVVLTGGVFQNTLLVWMVTEGLRREGLNAWQNEQVPANDGGVALGQAVVARELIKGSTAKGRGERA